jgi:hypothetical protein
MLDPDARSAPVRAVPTQRIAERVVRVELRRRAVDPAAQDALLPREHRVRLAL